MKASNKITLKPRTALELGIMRGFPPPPEKRPDLTNWDLPPFNRWSFMNIRNLFPSVDVKASRETRRKLPRAIQDLSSVSFVDDCGNAVDLPDFLYGSYTDGFLVMHRGEVIVESYFNDMQVDTPHLAQSVSKSIVGALAGILAQQGLVDVKAPLEEYVPELKRCGYRDATVSQALNMTSGVRFVEEYDHPDSDMRRVDTASGWRPVADDETRPTIRDIILTLPRVRPHGQVFAYKSIDTDVVAWVLERAARQSLADLVSDLIWKKIGAEHNAFFTVDHAATALADGGFNASLRDYARFGLMMQNDGYVGSEAVVPKHWIDQCVSGNIPVETALSREICPEGAYSNFWWVNNIEKGDFMARGVFGQMIYINRTAELTIVKLSTWPDYLITSFTLNSLAAFGAIKKHLS
jgi:CubicO group peptidase (beta-lactamase class C family)